VGLLKAGGNFDGLGASLLAPVALAALVRPLAGVQILVVLPGLRA